MSRIGRALALGCCAWLALAPSRALASPTRVALVVGNDVGDAGGFDLGALQHAERDALRMRDHLVRYGQFPPENIEVVVGGTRAEVLAAATRLAERHRAVRAALGPEVPTLFVFSFNGHGLDGELLTTRGGLSGADIGRIFRELGADVAIGLFDACDAGAVDFEALAAKGIRRTPGFNPAAVVPVELLTSQGTVWLSSSGRGEVSYEDPAVGSLFTHYFLEAFTRAERQGPGVDLDAMWHYARQRTARHAARFGRRQNPLRRINRLRSSGPLYLSFPGRRSATLVFEAAVAGRFTVRMDGGLVEQVDKAAGEPAELAVYPGALLIGPADGPPAWTAEVADGDRLVLGGPSTLPATAPGHRVRALRSMGATGGRVLIQERRQATHHLGLDYQLAGPDPLALAPSQRIALVGHRISGRWALDGRIGYGFGARDFAAWRADVHAPFAGLGLGWGVRWGRLRLDGHLGAEAELAYADYGAASKWSLAPAGALSARAWYGGDGWGIALIGGMRAAWSEALPAGSTTRALRPAPMGSVQLIWP